MGFFGLFVVARSDRPVHTLRSVELMGDGDPRSAPVAVAADGAWQLLQVYRGRIGDRLGMLVEETAAPAIAIEIIDSDFGWVEASSPQGVSWRTYLHPEMAVSYEAPPPPMSTDEAALLAVRWAAETGRIVPPEPVAVALEADPGDFGEGVDELMTALGFTFGPSRTLEGADA